MPLLYSNAWMVTVPLKIIDHVLNAQKSCGIGPFFVLFNLKFSVIGAERVIIFLQWTILIICRAYFPPNLFMIIKYCKLFESKFSMLSGCKNSLHFDFPSSLITLLASRMLSSTSYINKVAWLLYMTRLHNRNTSVRDHVCRPSPFLRHALGSCVL